MVDLCLFTRTTRSLQVTDYNIFVCHLLTKDHNKCPLFILLLLINHSLWLYLHLSSNYQHVWWVGVPLSVKTTLIITPCFAAEEQLLGCQRNSKERTPRLPRPVPARPRPRQWLMPVRSSRRKMHCGRRLTNMYSKRSREKWADPQCGVISLVPFLWSCDVTITVSDMVLTVMHSKWKH